MAARRVVVQSERRPDIGVHCSVALGQRVVEQQKLAAGYIARTEPECRLALP